MSETLAAEQFKILSIELTADRFAQQVPFILAAENKPGTIVAEFNIYENVTLPYLTANMILQDDQDLYRKLDLQGTERVKIRYKSKASDGGNTSHVEKNFVIVNIQADAKHNDYTSILMINMIEDIGYYDKVLSISKAYTGKGEEIIENIIRDNLNRGVDTSNVKASAQAPFKYLVPYLTPFNACKTILAKITTDLGMPYFLYSSVASDDLILIDFETAFSKEAFNSTKPFTFSQAGINSNQRSFEKQVFSISSYQSTYNEDTLKLARTGGVGASYTLINVTTGEDLMTDVVMKDKIDNAVASGGLPSDMPKVMIDDKFVPDPSKSNPDQLHTFTPNNYLHVTNSPFPFDQGFTGFSEESSISLYELRVAKNGFLRHLMKNIYQLNLPGHMFNSNSKQTIVGTPININIYKNDVISVDKSSTGSLIDEKKSGKYFMLAKRHAFNIINETHVVAVDVARVTNPESRI